jgi:hypothetical protein
MQDLREALSRIYLERKNLALSLRNLESVVRALASFLAGAIVIISLFLLQIAFSTGDYAEVRPKWAATARSSQLDGKPIGGCVRWQPEVSCVCR